MSSRSISIAGSRTEVVLYAVAALAGFFIVWQLLVMYTAVGMVMPSPIEVVEAMVASCADPIGSKTLPMHILFSLRRVLIGYLLAVLIGAGYLTAAIL